MPDPAPAELSSFLKLLALVNMTAKPFGRLYERQFQITLPEWRVMLTLADRPGLTAMEVGEALGLDKMAVSRAVRGLEARGRVERQVRASDARSLELRLTPAGWALYRTIAPAGRERADRLFEVLDAGERRTLDALLDRLVAHARTLPDSTAGD